MADKLTTSEKRQRDKFNRIRDDMSEAMADARKDIKVLAVAAANGGSSLLDNKNIVDSLAKSFMSMANAINDGRTEQTSVNTLMSKFSSILGSMDKMNPEMQKLLTNITQYNIVQKQLTKNIEVSTLFRTNFGDYLEQIKEKTETGGYETPEERVAGTRQLLDLIYSLPVDEMGGQDLQDDLYQAIVKAERVGSRTGATTSDFYRSLSINLENAMNSSGLSKGIASLEDQLMTLEDAIDENSEAVAEGGGGGIGGMLGGAKGKMGAVMNHPAMRALKAVIASEFAGDVLYMNDEIARMAATGDKGAGLTGKAGKNISMRDAFGIQQDLTARGAGGISDVEFKKLTTDLGKYSSLFNESVDEMYDSVIDITEGFNVSSIDLAYSIDDTIESVLALAAASGLGAPAILAMSKQASSFTDNLKEVATADQRTEVFKTIQAELAAAAANNKVSGDLRTRVSSMVVDIMSDPKNMAQRLGRLAPEQAADIMTSKTRAEMVSKMFKAFADPNNPMLKAMDAIGSTSGPFAQMLFMQQQTGLSIIHDYEAAVGGKASGAEELRKKAEGPFTGENLMIANQVAQSKNIIVNTAIQKSFQTFKPILDKSAEGFKELNKHLQPFADQLTETNVFQDAAVYWTEAIFGDSKQVKRINEFTRHSLTRDSGPTGASAPAPISINNRETLVVLEGIKKGVNATAEETKKKGMGEPNAANIANAKHSPNPMGGG